VLKSQSCHVGHIRDMRAALGIQFIIVFQRGMICIYDNSQHIMCCKRDLDISASSHIRITDFIPITTAKPLLRSETVAESKRHCCKKKPLLLGKPSTLYARN
jgi:hypothetical protein